MNQIESLDILAFGAHPDDVELAASGTILKHIALGKKVGIVDLTRGEKGTRGTANDRDLEAKRVDKKKKEKIITDQKKEPKDQKNL